MYVFVFAFAPRKILFKCIYSCEQQREAIASARAKNNKTRDQAYLHALLHHIVAVSSTRFYNVCKLQTDTFSHLWNVDYWNRIDRVDRKSRVLSTGGFVRRSLANKLFLSYDIRCGCWFFLGWMRLLHVICSILFWNMQANIEMTANPKQIYFIFSLVCSIVLSAFKES